MGARYQTALVLCAVAALTRPQAAFAQQTSDQDVVARLQAVEAQVNELRQENIELRGEVARLKGAPSNSAPVQPVALAPAPAVAATDEASSPAPDFVAPVAPAPPSRWDRAYVGVGAGLIRLNSSAAVTTSSGSYTFSRAGHRAAVTFDIGRRWLRDSVAIGMEGEVAFPIGHLTNDYDFGSLVLQNYARMKGQVGFARESYIIYGTGGVQFSKVKLDLPPNVSGESFSDYHTSLFYGVGVENRLSRDISLDFEATTTTFRTVEFERKPVRLFDLLASLHFGF